MFFTLLFAIFRGPLASLLDSLSMKLNILNYGHLRCFGSVGFGLSGVLVGALIETKLGFTAMLRIDYLFHMDTLNLVYFLAVCFGYIFERFNLSFIYQLRLLIRL